MNVSDDNIFTSSGQGFSDLSQSNILSSLESNLNNMKSALVEVKANAETLQQEYAVVTNQMSRLSNSIEDLKYKINNLEENASFVDLRSSLEYSQKTKINEQIAQLKTELNELTSQYLRLRQQSNVQFAAIGLKMTEKNHLENSIQSIEQEVAKLKHETIPTDSRTLTIDQFRELPQNQTAIPAPNFIANIAKRIKQKSTSLSEDIGKTEVRTRAFTRAEPVRGGQDRSNAMLGTLFSDDEIIDVKPLEKVTDNTILQLFREEPEPLKGTFNGKMVIQQQGLKTCAATCAVMLILDKKGSVSPELIRDIRQRNVLSTDEVILQDIKSEGLIPIYTLLESGDSESIKNLVSKYGSAIVGIIDRIGGHYLIVDSFTDESIQIKAVDVRDPYHGWAITINREAFEKRIKDEEKVSVIQIQ